MILWLRKMDKEGLKRRGGKGSKDGEHILEGRVPCSDGMQEVLFFMIKQRNNGDIMKHTAYITVI